MRRRIDIDRALLDKNLLGAALGDLTPWKVWRVVLKAAFALGLGTDEERAIFEEISGGRPLPAKRVRELWAVVARRGGKSRMAAAIGVYLALFVPRNLAPGEVGEVTIIAATREQASVVFKYVVGFPAGVAGAAAGDRGRHAARGPVARQCRAEHARGQL